MEIEIFTTINYSLILVTPFEYIKSFFYDFVYNNEKKIKELNLKHHIDNQEKASIYIAKLMFHNERFSKYS